MKNKETCLLKFNNSIIKDLNESEADEILNNKLKRIMIRVTSEIKEDMYKHLNEF
jgi:hypothetical protein